MTAEWRRPADGKRTRLRLRPALAIAAIVLTALALSWSGFSWAGQGRSHGARSGDGPGMSRSSAGLSPSAVPSPGAEAPASPPARTATSASPVAGNAASSAAPGTRAATTGLGGLGWVNFHGVELPVSASAGPRVTRDGLAWGFADTPLGALLAAVNIAVRANAQWGPGIFVPAIKAQVIGPDAAALLAGCRAAYAHARRPAGVPEGKPLGPAYVREEAYRWVSYRPADAVVDIVSAGPNDQGEVVRAVTWIAMRWSHGDWRALAPPGGDWGNAASSLTSLRGYTALPIPPA